MVLWISLGFVAIGGVVEVKNINSFARFKSCFDLLDPRFGI
jgi:hypothetical protein